MKKIFLVAIIAGLSFSCGKKTAEEQKEVQQEEPIQQEVKEDSAAVVVVGNDADENDCKPSTGYTWSALKKECVKLSEVGTELKHADDGKEYTTVAYVIFDGDKAELFLDTQKKAILLERKSEGESWVNGDYILIPWKGYVLKKGDDIIYTGQ
ncbi:hypothetical protein [Flavobacterium hercynium]|uniref:Lipoprotein n=1 Tax=Flavobacterium hercynium TaxID=387094 RepID=A0A226GWQ9_9FLAO|nr:hypothetical protein [Flavobacterium hercynium]OXA86365.1 hypothetical protein B0A66_17955 [Flavobacterium hercynium]SMP17655.1 hypothetical protein SAMN06265346_105171 [Flavobacterium hercynium]